MKSGLIIFLLMSTSAFAQVVNVNWVYHPTKCVAQTTCPDGRVISCSTVGFNYGRGVAPVARNMCASRVILGDFVRCIGYADRPNAFGGVTFVPADYSVSCY
ncbi:MAG: hypothetical protein CME65_00820 [Halobacteriovoraceae bacterium]|nr:hypothetical protein [Halobacteriovoraceae bacterium]